MNTIEEKVKSLVSDNSNEAYNLSAQMIGLEVVQGAVASLLERLDEITFKEWHKDPGMARLSIKEIQDTVRLINMGFYPLYTEMRKTAETLEGVSGDLFNTVVKCEGGKPSINSLIGWNYYAMDNNIHVFKKEVGREPESFEEVSRYIAETAARVVAECGVKKQAEKADAPTSTNEKNL